MISPSSPRLEDRALDACMVGLSIGAALNLALAQASLLFALLLVTWRALRGDAALREAVRDLGPVLPASIYFIVACILSTVVTAAPFPGVFEATRWRVMLAVPVGALAFSMRGERLVRWCVMAFAAGCALHAVVGLVQVFTELTPFADLLKIPVERRRMEAPGRPDLRSAVGLFYNRVRLSHVLAAGVACAWGMIVFAKERRALWAAISVVTLAGLVATYGRAALMALLFVAAVVALLMVLGGDAKERNKRLLLGGGAMVLVVIVLFAIPPTRERMLSALDLSKNADRLFLWGRGVEMAADHAPYGTGLGGYSVVRDAYYDRVDPSIQSRAMSHNLLLSLLAETGILGLLAWVWMWWELFKRAVESRHPCALIGAMAASTFHAATLAHDPLYQSEVALAWCLCASFMVAVPGAPDDGDAL